MSDTKYERPAHWTDDDVIEDLHARYHCEEGNLLGRAECGWERCEFWDAAKFVADTVGLATTGGETEWGLRDDETGHVTDWNGTNYAAHPDHRNFPGYTVVTRSVPPWLPWVPVDPTSPETTEEQP